MAAVKYQGFNDARSHLKDLLDAAEAGQAAVVQRAKSAAVLVDRDRHVEQLRHAVAPRIRLVPDDEGWLATVSGLPLAGEGDTPSDAVEDLIDAVRDYAEDWHHRLRHAPNHEHAWPLVQLVELSDDAELLDWVMGRVPGA